MKIKIQHLNKNIFLVCWILLIYFVSYNLIDQGTKVKNGYLYLLLIAISLYIMIFSKNRARISKSFGTILLFLLLFVVWILLASVITKYGNLAEDNINSYTLFIIFLLTSATVISKLKIRNSVIYVSTVEIGLILLERFFRYRDKLNGINLQYSFFRVGQYKRITFGFQHVNTCGNLCVLEICLLTFAIYLISKTVKNLFLKNTFRAAAFAMLLLTGYIVLLTSTRTAILCSILYFIILLVMFFLNTKNNILKRIIVIIDAFLLIIAVIFAAFNNMLTMSYFDLLTGRNNLLNLMILKDPVSIIFGTGFVNPGLFGTGGLSGSQTTWMDNYYIYILLTSGIVGFILNISVLVKLGFDLKKKSQNRVENKIVLCVFIVFCVYGLFETSVIFPHFLFSVVLLPLVISYSLE